MTPGLKPRPRAEVAAWLWEMAKRYEGTTPETRHLFVKEEMYIREKGGLIYETN